HASGIVAVVAAGVVIARYGSSTGKLHGTQLLGFWNLLAFVLNAILFILVGAALPASKLLPVAGLVVVAFVVMLITRAVPVYSLLGGVDWRAYTVPVRWRHFTVWGWARRAVSVAPARS